MAYCRNCGCILVEGAKFCQKCGTATGINSSQGASRQQEFAGKIYKCPNCGEVLQSFVRNCPSCGLELRSVRATSSIREFALKLEAIESKREYEKPSGLFSSTANSGGIPKTDKQKISLIQNFSVPNTKEDMLEFMILATSNINPSLFGLMLVEEKEDIAQKAVANAWLSKVKQVYEKAKASKGNGVDFQRINELYSSCVNEIHKQKKKRAVKWILLVGVLPMLLIINCAIYPVVEAREEARLEAIVDEVEESLDNGNYRLALLTAESIEYDGGNDERERWWGIQKEALIAKVIDEASENGVLLERKPTATNTPTVDTTSEQDSNINNLLEAFEAFGKAFTEGYEGAMDGTSK